MDTLYSGVGGLKPIVDSPKVKLITRTLSEPLRSRNVLARFNDLLASILASKIGVLADEIYEQGIDPGVLGIPKSKSRAPPAAASEIAFDSSERTVKEAADSAAQP